MMRKISLLFFTCLLSSCSFLKENEPLPLYSLKSGFFEPKTVLSVPLAIDIPLSEASLNTSRIATTPSPYRRDYLANSEWPDRLPKVFHEALMEGLGQRWGENYITRTSVGLQYKYMLHSEIQDFSVYHLDQESPEVRLKITFKFINLRERRIVAAHTFETSCVSSLTVEGIIGAFNQGLHTLLETTMNWMEDIFLKESLLNPANDKLSSKRR